MQKAGVLTRLIVGILLGSLGTFCLKAACPEKKCYNCVEPRRSFSTLVKSWYTSLFRKSIAVI